MHNVQCHAYTSSVELFRAGCLDVAESATLETALPTPLLFTWDTAGVDVLDIVIWLPIDVTPSWTWLAMGDSVCMPLLVWLSWSMSRLAVWIWLSLLRCSRVAAPSLPLPGMTNIRYYKHTFYKQSTPFLEQSLSVILNFKAIPIPIQCSDNLGAIRYWWQMTMGWSKFNWKCGTNSSIWDAEWFQRICGM